MKKWMAIWICIIGIGCSVVSAETHAEYTMLWESYSGRNNRLSSVSWRVNEKRGGFSEEQLLMAFPSQTGLYIVDNINDPDNIYFFYKDGASGKWGVASIKDMRICIESDLLSIEAEIRPFAFDGESLYYVQKRTGVQVFVKKANGMSDQTVFSFDLRDESHQVRAVRAYNSELFLYEIQTVPYGTYEVRNDWERHEIFVHMSQGELYVDTGSHAFWISETLIGYVKNDMFYTYCIQDGSKFPMLAEDGSTIPCDASYFYTENVSLSPDGKYVAYTVHANDRIFGFIEINMDSFRRKIIITSLETGKSVQYYGKGTASGLFDNVKILQ